MSKEELIELLKAELKDDIIGEVTQCEDSLKIIFHDGTQRTITIK